MAAPIVPWQLESGGSGESLFYQFRKGEKQTRPINNQMQLPYENRTTRIRNKGHSASHNMWAWQVAGWGNPEVVAANYNSVYTAAVNLAYERLLAQVRSGADASLGETLGEIASSHVMVVKRLTQITDCVRALKRRDIKSAAAALSTKSLLRKPKKWDSSKSVAGAFLELHLGWEPLIKDIYNALQVLSAPLPVFLPAKGKAKTPFGGDLAVPVNASNPSAIYPANTRQISYTKIWGTLWVKQGCYVSVSNPNLYLATSLGLTNPASVAWALVPFSFVIDWFANVSQVLDSMSDFLGLSVSGGHTSFKIEATYVNYHFATYKWWEGDGYVHGGGLFRNTTANISGYARKVGLILPSLQLKPARGFSPLRGATAAALLVQLLPQEQRHVRLYRGPRGGF